MIRSHSDELMRENDYLELFLFFKSKDDQLQNSNLFPSLISDRARVGILIAF